MGAFTLAVCRYSLQAVTPGNPVLPITEDQLAAIVAHMPRRHQALVILAAGTGLQQGEIFGLTVDRLDLERRNVLVDRQLINVNGREPSSATQVPGQPPRLPLPGVVADALRAHLEAYPATALVFTNKTSAPRCVGQPSGPSGTEPSSRPASQPSASTS